MLEYSQVIKIMTNFSPLYQNIVKEFIINIPQEFNKDGSKDYMKVHVRGCCIGFSSEIINEYLSRSKLITANKVLLLNIIAQEIAGRVYEDWTSKRVVVYSQPECQVCHPEPNWSLKLCSYKSLLRNCYISS